MKKKLNEDMPWAQWGDGRTESLSSIRARKNKGKKKPAKKKKKVVKESRSFLKEILTELHNCVRHEQEEVPLVWSKAAQQKITDTDHWDRAQARAKSHVGNMDFQDDEDQNIMVPYNDNYGHPSTSPDSSDFNPSFGMADDMFGGVGDNEEVGGFASAPWGDWDDEDEFADEDMYSDTDETAFYSGEEQQEVDPEDDESFGALGRRDYEQDQAADYEQDMYNLRRGRVGPDDPANDNYRGFGGSEAGDTDMYPSDPDDDFEDTESSFFSDKPLRSRFKPPVDPDDDTFGDEDRMVDVGDDEDYEDMSDVEADADTLRSAGMGTDEDYGYFGDEEEELPRFKDFYRLDDENGDVPARAKKKFRDDSIDFRGRQKIAKPRRPSEEQQEETPMGMGAPPQGGPQGGQNQMSQSRQANPDESTPTNMAVDQQYGPDDPNEKGEDFADATGTGEQQEWDDPDYQGVIRVVPNAHLVHKRQQEDGTFNELWMYNLGHDFKREMKIRRGILAGTDIPPNKVRSPDKKQSFELWTAGNGQILHIKGLPN